MADGDSGGDIGGDVGGMDSGSFDNSGSTGYGGGPYANSETGVFSSPQVDAYTPKSGSPADVRSAEQTQARQEAQAGAPIGSFSWDKTTPEQAAAQKGGLVTTHVSPAASALMQSPGTANFSNTGAPGSQMLPASWTPAAEQNRAQNLIDQSTNRDWISQQAAAWNARPHESSPQTSTPLAGKGLTQAKQPVEQPAEKPKEKDGGGMSGIHSMGNKSSAPDWITGKGYPNYTVQRARYPFQPQIPIAGSGVKRSFFTTQEELLKAMMPGWK